MNKPAKILLVNDKPSILKLLRKTLENGGYKTFGAKNGTEALQKIERYKPDLICLEIDLPDMPGIELIENIKANPQFGDISVIFISAKFPTSFQQANGLEKGANGYITYPVSDRELLARIQTLLRIQNTEKALKSLQEETQHLLKQSELSRQTLLSLLEDQKSIESALRESEEKYRNLVERAYDGIVVIQDNLIKFANPQLAKLLGYSIEEVIGTPYSKYIHPEELPLIQDRYIRRMRGESIPTRYETRLLRKDGTVVNVELNAGIVPYEGKPGDLVFIRDITERKKAEEMLQRQTELEAFIANVSVRFIHLLPEEMESTISGVLGETALLLQADRSYIFLFEKNQSKFFPFYEWTSSGIEPLKEKVKDFPYEAFPELIKQLKKLEPISVPSVADLPKEATLAKQILKAYHIQSILLVPILWQKELKGVIGIDTVRNSRTWTQQDLYLLTTLANMFGLLFQRLEKEQEVKKTLQEKEMLLRELYHRTKNNMMIMSSMIALESEKSNREETKNILRELDGKIQTMALVHQKLYQSQDLSQVDLKEYLSELVELLVKNYRIGSLDISVEMDIEPLKVLFDVAIPLGLVVNELISNSLKYAFPNREKGKIEIQLKETPLGEIELFFADNGIGLPEPFKQPLPNTLGFQTIFMIIENQLQGKVRFVSDHGLKWYISLGKTLYKERV